MDITYYSLATGVKQVFVVEDHSTAFSGNADMHIVLLAAPFRRRDLTPAISPERS